MGSTFAAELVQFNVDVDGYDHGWEVIVLKIVSHFVGPSLRQVDGLRCKFIEQKLNASLPVCQLQGCRWQMEQSAWCAHHSLEIQTVGACVRTDTTVLKSSSSSSACWFSEGGSGPNGARV